MVNADYLYDKNFYENLLGKEHFKNIQLSFKVYDNAFIVPFRNFNGKVTGGVYTNEYEFLENTSVHYKFGAYIDKDKISPVRTIGEQVIYLGMMLNCWGHHLTDNIRRAWFVYTEDYAERYRDCKFVYVPAGGTNGFASMPENMMKFLNIIGIRKEQLIPIYEITQCKNLIIPDESFYNDENGVRYFTKEYINTIGKVRSFQARKFVKEVKYEKVYFTYSGYKSNKQIGEEKLEKFFRNLGYTVVAPENYTLEQQLNILANCHYFASTIGSCSHNMIFLPEHSFVYLIPRAFYLTGYQVALDEVIDLNIYYIDSSLSILTPRDKPWEGPFYYFVSDNLASAFGVEIKESDSYWKHNLGDEKKYLRIANKFFDIERRVPPQFYIEKFMYYTGKYWNSRRNIIYLWKIWYFIKARTISVLYRKLRK
jgi:hypothetical protein